MVDLQDTVETSSTLSSFDAKYICDTRDAPAAPFFSSIPEKCCAQDCLVYTTCDSSGFYDCQDPASEGAYSMVWHRK